MAKQQKSKQSEPSISKLDETGFRSCSDQRVKSVPVAEERRKNNRRRHIDPTTCEREYNENEIEFMRAMDDYKQASGRMFPTCSEILEVLMKLGYKKVENVFDSQTQTALPIATENLFLDEATNV